MKIGVLSDTHLRSIEELPRNILEAFSEVDLIVHAGDFVMLPVLEGLRRMGETKAVRGNMDSPDIKGILPEKELLVVNGKRIGVIHGSGAPWGIESRVREQFDQVDVIIFGHTHQAKNEMAGGVLFFNPGPAKDSYGILQIDDEVKGQIVRVGY
jgi:putative phosphoesterase